MLYSNPLNWMTLAIVIWIMGFFEKKPLYTCAAKHIQATTMELWSTWKLQIMLDWWLAICGIQRLYIGNQQSFPPGVILNMCHFNYSIRLAPHPEPQNQLSCLQPRLWEWMHVWLERAWGSHVTKLWNRFLIKSLLLSYIMLVCGVCLINAWCPLHQVLRFCIFIKPE